MTNSAGTPAPTAGVERARPAQERRKSRLAPFVLDPAVLPDHIDALFRAAWALCGSRADAEDLVQTTFVRVLRRPRMIRNGSERAYLLTALRNTYSSGYRSRTRAPAMSPLPEDDRLPAEEPSTISAGELMGAIATAPPRYRDAVIAVDVLGLSYREAATAMRTHEKTVATRVHRGRRHIARELLDGSSGRGSASPSERRP
jgi:RNA polymerase sigma-70 factor (ECF subfamily)